MVEQNHYRWDFIGLSTDTKPTPADSEKVTDGSTYYTSDNSKLYVWYKDQWYEKEVEGGGGGTSYTAGDGIDITNDTISVDTDTIQEKLTAGTNITINDNVISASGGGSGGSVTELTSADYNYPDNNPNSVALWKLPAGLYYRNNSVAAYVGVTRPMADGQNFIQVMVTSGSNSVKINIMGTSGGANDGVYQVLQSFGVASTGAIIDFGGALTTSNLKQATGTSTTDVMSQNATTSMIYADPAAQTKIKIGAGTSTIEGNDGVEIGHNAYANGMNSIALGYNAGADATGAVAVGFGSYAHGYGRIALGATSGSNDTTQGVMTIGPNNTYYGYNNTKYRLLTGLYDGQGIHDAATVAQGNTLSTSAPTTSTVGVLGQLYTDTTNMHTYQLTAIDTTDPSNPSYTWQQRW